MNYQTLRNAWEHYPRHYDISYKESINSGIWNYPLSHIREKVDFLNKWLCRIDRNTAIPDIEEQSERFNNILQRISPLNLLSLTDQNLEALKQTYKLLANINGLGPTGISKYMHMHKRELFIMWDTQIFKDYFHLKTYSKITATAKKYGKFMLQMRDEIQEAIHTFPSSNNFTETQAIEEFRRDFNNETLPRIIDKYNFTTREQLKQLIN